jgi:glycosyltransferase involved in cell wall biosynthesis
MPHMTRPETSVIIPVHNGARFIADAIASVLAQLGEGDEVLAVDDRSTDETPAILSGFLHPALRVLSSGASGVSAARNTGFAASRGAFIAFLDHDDLWPARRHKALRAAFEQDEGLEAVYGRIVRRYEPGARKTPESRIEGHHAGWLIGSGLYRRELLERAGGFAEDMPMGEDVDFYLRLGEAGMRASLCEAPGLIRRHHDANATNDLERADSWRLNILRRKLSRAKASTRAR